MLSKQKKQPQGGKMRKKINKSTNGNSRTYQVAPVSTFSSTKFKGPSYSQRDRNSKTVTHSEFIGNVNGSVAFTNTIFYVNPGMSTTFPWLSFETIGWEKFRFQKLTFRYEAATATTATGAVILAPDYDASDLSPASEIVIMDYQDRAYGPPWAVKPIVCNVNPKSLNSNYNQHFVRSGLLSANQDIKLYDPCNFSIATVGQANSNAIGKLFVDYTVTFSNPQLPYNGANSLVPSGGRFVSGGTQSAGNPLGTVPTPDAQNVGISIDATSRTLFDKIGDYLVEFVTTGTTITDIIGTAVSGCVVTEITQLLNTAATIGNATYNVAVSAANALVDWTMAAATVTNGTVMYIGYDPVNALLLAAKAKLNRAGRMRVSIAPDVRLAVRPFKKVEQPALDNDWVKEDTNYSSSSSSSFLRLK